MPAEPVRAALAAQHAELRELVADLDEAQWALPSRCEGWTVSDVLLHLVQTDRMALASLEHRLPQVTAEMAGGLAAGSVDEGAALMVERERDQPGAEVRARWEAGTEALRRAFDAGDPHDRLTWVAGELSATTLASTRLAETWIHTGDIAAGLGVELQPTTRLWHIARLAWRTLPYAFSTARCDMSGPVSFDLVGPDGERWRFDAPEPPVTTIAGDAHELCLVAARRVLPGDTSLRGAGPDADAVLALVRTYA